jgi:ABC-type transport system involved in multi-copper enzyme maturation permease subunit
VTVRIFTHALWGYRTALLFVVAGLLLFETLIAIVWQSLGEATATAFVDLLPQTMRDLMEAQFGFVPTGGVSGWLAGLNRHPLYLVLLGAFVVGAGAGTVAREIERGSILLVLSRPIARWRFLLGKIAASTLGLLVLAAMSLLGLYVGAAVIGADLETRRFLVGAVNSFLLFLTVQGVAVLLSAARDDAGAAAGQTAGIVVAAYFLDFLANLWDPAASLGRLSFFHYYNPAEVVRTGVVPWVDLGVLLLAATALHGAALALFERRDIGR